MTNKEKNHKSRSFSKTDTPESVKDGPVDSEQKLGDQGQQLAELRLHVGRLSDGVAPQIKALQSGAGGQRLEVRQGGDF